MMMVGFLQPCYAKNAYADAAPDSHAHLRLLIRGGRLPKSNRQLGVGWIIAPNGVAAASICLESQFVMYDSCILCLEIWIVVFVV